MTKDWIYYRIYAKPVEKWYEKLLNEVVKPFVDKNRQITGCIWFNRYFPNYLRDEPCEQKFKEGAVVRYIRLRVLASRETIPKLEKDLTKLIKDSPTVLEKEKCVFREKKILTKEFGSNRIELSKKYLNICSEIALSLLTPDNEMPSHTEKQLPIKFLHYLCNMLKVHDRYILQNKSMIADFFPEME